eukprot:scaffold1498_cov314-Prasinococcus_capsulatus_cf.AAC.5
MPDRRNTARSNSGGSLLTWRGALWGQPTSRPPVENGACARPGHGAAPPGPRPDARTSLLPRSGRRPRHPSSASPRARARRTHTRAREEKMPAGAAGSEPAACARFRADASEATTQRQRRRKRASNVAYSTVVDRVPQPRPRRRITRADSGRGAAQARRRGGQAKPGLAGLGPAQPRVCGPAAAAEAAAAAAAAPAAAAAAANAAAWGGGRRARWARWLGWMGFRVGYEGWKAGGARRGWHPHGCEGTVVRPQLDVDPCAGRPHLLHCARESVEGPRFAPRSY